jgi:hypothetical protein
VKPIYELQPIGEPDGQTQVLVYSIIYTVCDQRKSNFFTTGEILEIILASSLLTRENFYKTFNKLKERGIVKREV